MIMESQRPDSIPLVFTSIKTKTCTSQISNSILLGSKPPLPCLLDAHLGLKLTIRGTFAAIAIITLITNYFILNPKSVTYQTT
jgi:hypothetical protein